MVAEDAEKEKDSCDPPPWMPFVACARHSIQGWFLVLEDGSLQIELKGDLAAILALKSKHPRGGTSGVQVTLVAGVRFWTYFNPPVRVALRPAV